MFFKTILPSFTGFYTFFLCTILTLSTPGYSFPPTSFPYDIGFNSFYDWFNKDIKPKRHEVQSPKDPIVNARKTYNSHIEVAAMLLAMSSSADNRVYVLGRDMEYIAFAVKYIAGMKGVSINLNNKFYHISENGSDYVGEPGGVSEYLKQYKFSDADIRDLKRVYVVDTAYAGSAISGLAGRLSPDVQPKIIGELMSSGNPVYATTLAFQAALDCSLKGFLLTTDYEHAFPHPIKKPTVPLRNKEGQLEIVVKYDQKDWDESAPYRTNAKRIREDMAQHFEDTADRIKSRVEIHKRVREAVERQDRVNLIRVLSDVFKKSAAVDLALNHAVVRDAVYRFNLQNPNEIVKLSECGIQSPFSSQLAKTKHFRYLVEVAADPAGTLYAASTRTETLLDFQERILFTVAWVNVLRSYNDKENPYRLENLLSQIMNISDSSLALFKLGMSLEEMNGVVAKMKPKIFSQKQKEVLNALEKMSVSEALKLTGFSSLNEFKEALQEARGTTFNFLIEMEDILTQLKFWAKQMKKPEDTSTRAILAQLSSQLGDYSGNHNCLVLQHYVPLPSCAIVLRQLVVRVRVWLHFIAC